MAIVRRGWDTFERLASVKYPTLALIKGFCLGGGLELALACRYRVVIDEPGTRLGLPEVLLGIVPGWGGIKRLPRLAGAPAALDMLLTGKTVDARRAKKLGIADECVPVRIMEDTARGVLRALAAAAHAADAARAHAQSDRAPLHRGAGGKAGGQARAPRPLSGALRDPRALHEVRRQRPVAASVGSGVDPFAARDAYRLQPDPRLPPAGAPEGSRQGGRVEGGVTCMSSAQAPWAATSPRGARCADSRSRCRTRMRSGSRLQ